MLDENTAVITAQTSEDSYKDILEKIHPEEKLVFEHLQNVHYYDPERDSLTASVIGRELNRVSRDRKAKDRFADWATPVCESLVKRGLLLFDEAARGYKINLLTGIEADLTDAQDKDYYTGRIKPHLEVIAGLRKKGRGIEDCAVAIGCNSSALYKYAKSYPELDFALRYGLTQLQTALEDSLYKRAMGYDYLEVKEKSLTDKDGQALEVFEKIVTTKHIPPDPQSLKFALLNRSREDWKHQDHVTNVIGKLSITNLLAEVNQKEGQKALKPLDPSKEISMDQVEVSIAKAQGDKS